MFPISCYRIHNIFFKETKDKVIYATLALSLFVCALLTIICCARGQEITFTHSNCATITLGLTLFSVLLLISKIIYDIRKEKLRDPDITSDTFQQLEQRWHINERLSIQDADSVATQEMSYEDLIDFLSSNPCDRSFPYLMFSPKAQVWIAFTEKLCAERLSYSSLYLGPSYVANALAPRLRPYPLACGSMTNFGGHNCRILHILNIMNHELVTSGRKEGELKCSIDGFKAYIIDYKKIQEDISRRREIIKKCIDERVNPPSLGSIILSYI